MRPCDRFFFELRAVNIKGLLKALVFGRYY